MSLVVPDTPSRPDRSFSERLELARAVAVMVHEVNDDAGIEIARARAHHEPAGRREPHRRIDRAPVLHRRHARPVAEVGDHRAPELRRAERLDDVLVREAVKAVAPHPRVEEIARQREALGDLGQRAMKGGVEAHHLRDVRETARRWRRARRAPRADGAARSARARVERRAQRRVDARGRAVLGPAVHEAMADRVRRAGARRDPAHRRLRAERHVIGIRRGAVLARGLAPRRPSARAPPCPADPLDRTRAPGTPRRARRWRRARP